MTTYTNANEATTATDKFVSELTLDHAKSIVDLNEPIISMYRFCCEIGLGGWCYMKNTKLGCCDVIMVAILNKLSVC